MALFSNDNKSLERIAAALEIIALWAAKQDGRMWSPLPPPPSAANGADEEEAELLQTTDEDMLVRFLKQYEQRKADGWENE